MKTALWNLPLLTVFMTPNSLHVFPQLLKTSTATKVTLVTANGGLVSHLFLNVQANILLLAKQR